MLERSYTRSSDALNVSGDLDHGTEDHDSARRFTVDVHSAYNAVAGSEEWTTSEGSRGLVEDYLEGDDVHGTNLLFKQHWAYGIGFERDSLPDGDNSYTGNIDGMNLSLERD